jgi:hypothetical protein
MSYEAKLKNMFVLQDKLNELVNTNWRTANNNWLLAAKVEFAEMADHLGYKWWKKQEPDFEQAFMELVDVVHFYISYLLEHKSKDEIEEFVDSYSEYANQAFVDKTSSINLDLALDTASSGLNVLSTAEINALEKIEFGMFLPLSAAFQSAYYFGETFDSLYEMYYAKNVLNIFRQQNGYKDGSYQKIWAGQEDNQVLAGLINQQPELLENSDELLLTLGQVYTKLTQ